MLCINSDYMEAVPKMDEKVLKKTGRGKFIKPLYQALNKKDSKLARELFDENKKYYSEIAIDMIENILNPKKKK